MTWGTSINIVIEDVHVANAVWSQEKEMFFAKRLEVSIFARSLLGGPLRMTSIAVDGAKLLLETSDRGDHNWDFGLASTSRKRVEPDG